MITIVSPTAGQFGGTERVLETLIKSSDAAGQFSIAFLEQGPLVDLTAEQGMPHRLIERGRFSNPINTLSIVAKLRAYLKQMQSSVALAWTDFAQLYSAPAAIGVCPSVWWQRTNIDRGMIAKLCRHLPSCGAIANSKFTRDQLRNAGVKVADEPLYPPYEAAAFAGPLDRNAMRDKLGLPKDRIIVGSVGRLQAWKGFHTFIQALEIVRESRPEVMGLIVGGRHDLEPDYEPKLHEHIAAAGLKDELRVTGSQRNVAEWMAAMDVFVHAAHREPFGIVVPEAMSLGLPVIASVPGGPAEVITDGVNGLLVPSGKASLLAMAIEHFVAGSNFAKDCGEAALVHARSFASCNFSGRIVRAVQQAAGSRFRI